MNAKHSEKGIQTVLDLIGCQYAKVIVKMAFFSKDHQGPFFDEEVTKKIFRNVDSGIKLWSEMNQSDWQYLDEDKECAYCGAKRDLQQTHILPDRLRIKPECTGCSKLKAVLNRVWICGSCAKKKGSRGVYEFYKARYPKEKRFYDMVPTTLERKYLKTIYHCHQCAGTLKSQDLDGDGELTVLDIDCVLRR